MRVSFNLSILGYADRVDEPATRSRQAKNHRSKGEQTRQAVLRAAIQRFGRDGYRATSVADIARDAGVGGSVPYTYFADKADLFTAALDEDTAGVMLEGLAHVTDDPDDTAWRAQLVFTLVEATDAHPLARRVLSGLEPEVTNRVVDLPALAELSKAVGERLREGQLRGDVRRDIDPVSVGGGAVAIIVSLMMSVLQLGEAGTRVYSDDVLAVFEAALEPPG